MNHKRSRIPTPDQWKAMWPSLAAFFAGFTLAAWQIPDSVDFCVDDAWIHLVYARNLALGEGVSYNAGDWETGFSSPMWVLLLAVVAQFGPPLTAVKLAGSILHGCCAWLGCRLANGFGSRGPRPASSRHAGWIAGLAIASHPQALHAAVSGMEVSLAMVLLLAALIADRDQNTKHAVVLAALATLARPECLFLLASMSALRWFWTRKHRALAPGIGAGLGLGSWIIYCGIVSGYPWPNTKYVKDVENPLAGLDYLMDQVLPHEPWLIGLGGVALAALAVARHRRDDDGWLLSAALAWAVSLLAIALSRELRPGVLFHARRYFTPLCAIPIVLMAVGATGVRLRWVVLALAPVTVITGLQFAQMRVVEHDQQRSVHLLHGKPARFVAEGLPPTARVAVEGAGALRWFTPASMTIIDILGLNDRELAHAPDDLHRACMLVLRQPTHFVLPEHMARPLSKAFDLEPLANFPDPNYAQVEPRHPLTVSVFTNRGARLEWKRRCAKLIATHANQATP